MSTAAIMTFDFEKVGGFSFCFSETDGEHAHYYADHVTGVWGYCERCRCFVTSPCDHRKRMCRDRKTAVGVGDD